MLLQGATKGGRGLRGLGVGATRHVRWVDAAGISGTVCVLYSRWVLWALRPSGPLQAGTRACTKNGCDRS